jgi:[ribosomal protein S5]-alanine N-acetyltransferase
MPLMRAPERVETERLILRRPVASDADAIFSAYASDSDVCRYVGFSRHRNVAETRVFLRFSDEQWAQWPAGPYLALLRETGELAGSSGLKFESKLRAATGYVFAKPYWGRGLATEVLTAMVDVARGCGVQRLEAICHAEHHASSRVLEKGGFTCEGRLRRYAEFPNIDSTTLHDVLLYSRIFEIPSSTEGEMRS